MKRWKRNLLIVLAVAAGGYFIFTLAINQFRTALVDLPELGRPKTALIAVDTPAWEWHPSIMDELPPVNEESGEIDVRHTDLSGADVSGKTQELLSTSFDDGTVWPAGLPEGFDAQQIMDIGKNPGLGIRKLHEQGITGEGVGVAIIDQGLLASHEQYRDNLKLYELYHCMDQVSSMHGAAVSSIAVGMDTGVAPGADLYYQASTFLYFFPPFGASVNMNHLAQSIERILEINRSLPDGSKIRVISISRGFSEMDIGGRALKAAIDKAKDEGVFVITASPDVNFDFILDGLGKSPLADPDDVTAYLPGSWWAADYYAYSQDSGEAFFDNMLLVPADCRTTACFTDPQEYVHYSTGGLSWSVPWLAGMYALCAQVQPEITPDEFVAMAFETGDIIPVEHNGITYQFGTIINPERLIEALR